MNIPSLHPRENEMQYIAQHLTSLISGKNITTITLHALKDNKVLAVIFTSNTALVEEFSKSVPDPSIESEWPEARQTLKRLINIPNSVSLMPEDNSEEGLSVDLRLDPHLSRNDILHSRRYTRTRIRRQFKN